MSLSRALRFQVALRSALLQGAWNYDRMQNLGWAYCVEPALKRLYADPAQLRAALKRHLELFNTHPYMAGYILGAALKVESEVAAGLAPAERVSELKGSLAPALAALGDSFFWAGLRPAAAVLGVAWLWLAPHPLHLAAPLVFLAAYNLPGLWLRFSGVEAGWAGPEGAAARVAGLGLPALTEGLRRFALVLVGAIAGSLARLSHPVTGTGTPLADNFLFLGAGLGMLLLMRLAVRPAVILALCALAALILALAFPMDIN